MPITDICLKHIQNVGPLDLLEREITLLIFLRSCFQVPYFWPQNGAKTAFDQQINRNLLEKKQGHRHKSRALVKENVTTLENSQKLSETLKNC